MTTELCENCGKPKEEHFPQSFNHKRVYWCNEIIGNGDEYTPQPQDASDNSQHEPDKQKCNPEVTDTLLGSQTISSLIKKTKKGCGKEYITSIGGENVVRIGKATCDGIGELPLCPTCQSRLQALSECADIFGNKINELYLDKCKEQGLDKSEWTEAEMFSLNELEKEIGGNSK